MKRTLTHRLARHLKSLALTIWLALVLLSQSQSQAQMSTGASRRPLPKLDTSRGIYIRADGTRVYKEPLPPKKRLFTYRRKDGKVVQTVTGPGRAYGSNQRAAQRPAQRNKRKRITRRSSRRH